MKEDERIAGLRKVLDGASPRVRREAIRLAVHGALEAARSAYTDAHQDGEKFKAHLISRNGQGLKPIAARLDEALDVFDALSEVGSLVVRAHSVAKMRADALIGAMNQLGAVCGAWTGCAEGLERGAGLSRYDTPDAVQAVKEDAARLHAKWLARSR